MTTWPTKHLTADDLDAFHSEALRSEMRLHLETCDACRELVALDHEVLAMLGRAPSLEPGAGFADRVMTKVRVGAPAPVPVLSFPPITPARRAALVGLGAGMAASVAWSLANRALLDRWVDGTAAAVWQWGNRLWQAGVLNLTAQPWFETARALTGSPIRIGLAAAIAIGLYATGLVILRRLVTPSSGSVSNAGA